MGNRSYLFLVKPEETNCLFEANNSLPFFWIGLLDKEILAIAFQNWIKNEKLQHELSEEEFEKYLEKNPNSIRINKNNFSKNSEKTRYFLEKNVPDALPLYNDFINHLNSKLEIKNEIEIDFTEFFGFFNSTQDLYDALLKELNAIENNNSTSIEFLYSSDLIASGTGFESLPNSEFSKLPNYVNQLKTRNIPTFKKEKKYTTLGIIINIVILILCPVFSIIAYKMWLEKGFNVPNILIIVLNLGFYVYSIWEFSAMIKYFTSKK